MADALVAAFGDAGVEGLVVLTGGIEARSLAPSVVVALGGFSGLWLGLGMAIVLYRVRRPVLSLRRALGLVSPTRVTLLDGRASWLGALRGPHRLRKGGRNEARPPANGLRTRAGAVEGLPGTGSSHTFEETLATRVLEGGTKMLVADAGTRETDLVLDAIGRDGEGVDLVWIR